MDNIRTEQDGGITNITIDSPDDGNRISDEMAAHLAGLMQQASEESKAIILRTPARTSVSAEKPWAGPGRNPRPWNHAKR